MSMYCYQCEQKMNDKACTIQGVCGKTEGVAKLQDVLIYMVKGISQYANRMRKLGVTNDEINKFTIEACFTTITNVNFDDERLSVLINKAYELKEKAKALYEKASASKGQTPERLSGPAVYVPSKNIEDLRKFAEEIGIEKRKQKLGDDVVGLHELITYGIKGASAYADHARILGKEDDKVYAFIHEAFDFLADNPTDINKLLATALGVGEMNIKAMELLDAGNTGTYGHPVPTRVRITPKKGKAILVSGHDLKDLHALLKQTEGTGINIYTHGEMLPTHAYPELKKFKHFAGNYGGAWQDQIKEFAKFPGSILMTTNCIQRPAESYKNRIFTSGLVAWPGVKHLENSNFKPLIDSALKEEGFKEDGEEKYITVGFGRNAVLSVADKVIDAVKTGKIKHFFLIGGCDGAKSGRNYYTEFAEKVPNDSVILTLACGKYRFNKLEFGDINGIPRLLDIGQCNDAYSAVQIAVALANAFNTDVNSLPLSLILSWYEQKAVAILLSLLHLGIKNIRLGPSLPAFVTPAALNILVEKFGIKPITTVDADLKDILGN